MKIPKTHKLTPLEVKLLEALQKALAEEHLLVANGHVFKNLRPRCKSPS